MLLQRLDTSQTMQYAYIRISTFTKVYENLGNRPVWLRRHNVKGVQCVPQPLPRHCTGHDLTDISLPVAQISNI